MENDWLGKWTEDIDQLELELPQRHKNLFFRLEKKDFYEQIQNLKKDLVNLDNYMIYARIMAIVASIRDAHTTVTMSVAKVIPFEFYWFSEGIYLVDTFGENNDALNCRVTYLNGIPIDEVIQRLTSIVSCENKSFLRAQLPKYLPAVELLYGLEIIDEFEDVEITFELQNGIAFTETVTTCEYSNLKRKIIKDVGVSQDYLPLYRKNKSKNFWSFFIEEHNTLYFKYNSCRDMQDTTVEDFCVDLLHFINQEEVKKLVIDLRNNLGGDSTLLDPFIEELSKCKILNREGSIFVILGRETFSSALLNAYSLKNGTKAIFVGEATGGKPNCYGEVLYFDLKNSKLRIRYSTEYYKIIKDDKQLSFFPEVNFEVTIKDYLDKRDPCMDYILSGTRGQVHCPR